LACSGRLAKGAAGSRRRCCRPHRRPCACSKAAAKAAGLGLCRLRHCGAAEPERRCRPAAGRRAKGRPPGGRGAAERQAASAYAERRAGSPRAEHRASRSAASKAGGERRTKRRPGGAPAKRLRCRRSAKAAHCGRGGGRPERNLGGAAAGGLLLPKGRSLLLLLRRRLLLLLEWPGRLLQWACCRLEWPGRLLEGARRLLEGPCRRAKVAAGGRRHRNGRAAKGWRPLRFQQRLRRHCRKQAHKECWQLWHGALDLTETSHITKVAALQKNILRSSRRKQRPHLPLLLLGAHSRDELLLYLHQGGSSKYTPSMRQIHNWLDSQVKC